MHRLLTCRRDSSRPSFRAPATQGVWRTSCTTGWPRCAMRCESCRLGSANSPRSARRCRTSRQIRTARWRSSSAPRSGWLGFHHRNGRSALRSCRVPIRVTSAPRSSRRAGTCRGAPRSSLHGRRRRCAPRSSTVSARMTSAPRSSRHARQRRGAQRSSRTKAMQCARWAWGSANSQMRSRPAGSRRRRRAGRRCTRRRRALCQPSRSPGSNWARVHASNGCTQRRR